MPLTGCLNPVVFGINLGRVLHHKRLLWFCLQTTQVILASGLDGGVEVAPVFVAGVIFFLTNCASWSIVALILWLAITASLFLLSISFNSFVDTRVLMYLSSSRNISRSTWT